MNPVELFLLIRDLDRERWPNWHFAGVPNTRESDTYAVIVRHEREGESGAGRIFYITGMSDLEHHVSVWDQAYREGMRDEQQHARKASDIPA